jgi:hypothetical protein
MMNTVGKRLMPVSDFTPTVLDFLERALPRSEAWSASSELAETDDNLRLLAVSSSPLADRAAALIGAAHRTHAMIALAVPSGRAHPALVAYENAKSLPNDIRFSQRLRLWGLLALRQLTRQPLSALGQYGWTAVGSSIAFAMLIYVSYYVADPVDILSTRRLLNTIGLGLLFGLTYAAGVWIARHIGQRLRIAPFWARLALGVVVGGLIVALGFTLFQQLVYEDVIDSSVSIPYGMLLVLGFAVSVGLPTGLQILAGAAGVSLALLIPWANYLANPDYRPPFIFDDTNPTAAIPLVILAALILAVLTLGYRLRKVVAR